MLFTQLQQLLSNVITKLYSEAEGLVYLEHPNELAHGDYATNIAMRLAKSLKKNPREVAQEIVDTLSHHEELSSLVSKIEIAGPGFINFSFSKEALLGELRLVLDQKQAYGRLQVGARQKVLVEYAQMNVAKPMHVGHLRTTILGDALKRLYLVLGYETVSDTHWGDWGTQFGIVLYAYKQEGDEAKVLADPVGELVRLYIEMNKQVEENPELLEAAKAEFKKLEDGDEENLKLWRWFVDASVKEFQAVFDRLGILPFDYQKGESDYNDQMKDEIADASKLPAAVAEGQLLYIDLEGQKLGRCILRKSDGATTYHLRDLATLHERMDDFGVQKNLYVVDSRQSHHFKQLFEVAKLLGWNIEGTEHISYGFVTLPEGSLSTRKGRIVQAAEVLEQGIAKAEEVIAEKNPELEHRQEAALEVARAAIKFANLSANRNTDIVFDWNQVVRFDGDTGPYLQYTYARVKSLMRKAGVDPSTVTDNWNVNESESGVLRILYRFPEELLKAQAQNDPSSLAQYLLSLAHAFNSFYGHTPIAQAEQKEERENRLALSLGVANVLRNGLWILGINVLEEM